MKYYKNLKIKEKNIFFSQIKQVPTTQHFYTTLTDVYHS